MKYGNAVAEPAGAGSPSSAGGTDVLAKLQEVLAFVARYLVFPLFSPQALAPKPARPSVDLAGFLKDKAKLDGLDFCAWPSSAFTDWLRDEAESQKAKGVKAPFVYVDLNKKCLPSWALALRGALRCLFLFLYN